MPNKRVKRSRRQVVHSHGNAFVGERLGLRPIRSIKLSDANESTGVWNLAWEPNGNRLAAESIKIILFEFDRLEIKSVKELIDFGGSAFAWANESKIFVVERLNEIFLLNSNDFSIINRISVSATQFPKVFSFSSDDKFLGCGTAQGEIIVWNTDSWEVILSDRLHKGGINEMAWSRNNKQIISVSDYARAICRNVGGQKIGK